MAKNGNLRFLLLELILKDQLADLLPPSRVNLVAKNGNIRFLLLELIFADQLADLTPMIPSGEEWQF